MNAKLNRKLSDLPTKPGVYLHKNGRGKILYVGKAKNLRNRVRSYFQAKADHDVKTKKLVEKVEDFDTVVTRNEVEALLLESNFIKQYKPPYNVVLRDDKHYQFIKITWQDDWPTVTTVRRVSDDGARYFGPYTSAYGMRSSLKTLRRVFPYCTSRDLNTLRQGREPCFYFQLGLCSGACANAISQSDYRTILDEFSRFLKGNTKDVVKQLESEMGRASKEHHYERAAAVRDKLRNLDALQQGQQAIDTKLGDRDAIGLARDAGHAVVTQLMVRDGRVVARNHFNFWGTGDADNTEIINSFLGQYYKVATNLPNEVLIPCPVENAALVAQHLSDRRERKVKVYVAQRGQKRDLVTLARENAEEHLRELRREWVADKERTDSALTELQSTLKLSGLPARIECYDISTLSGTSTVGSMVVFTDGQPAKAHYRRFQIRHVKGIDDFAAMQEVLRRRFARMKSEKSTDESFGTMPDLVIIDGGKGQVSAASTALNEMGLAELPLIGLAKRLEEVITRDATGEFTVRTLPADSQGLYLLQRVRDEAHRFAITYNRQMRSKRSVRSALDELPGIGPVKKKQLIKTFGSVARIRDADLPAIQEVVGKAAGRVVKENL